MSLLEYWLAPAGTSVLTAFTIYQHLGLPELAAKQPLRCQVTTTFPSQYKSRPPRAPAKLGRRPVRADPCGQSTRLTADPIGHDDIASVNRLSGLSQLNWGLKRWPLLGQRVVA